MASESSISELSESVVEEPTELLSDFLITSDKKKNIADLLNELILEIRDLKMQMFSNMASKNITPA